MGLRRKQSLGMFLMEMSNTGDCTGYMVVVVMMMRMMMMMLMMMMIAQDDRVAMI